MKQKKVLEAKGITKAFRSPYKVSLLKGISLTLKEGETVAIIGPSGVGKSTLLHILGTLDSFDEGSLSIMGEDVLKTPLHKIRKRHIGFLFQALHLLEEETALQNVLMPAKIQRLRVHKGSPIYKKGEALLKTLGILERKTFPVSLLSGGERERVAIARALILSPSLLLADEPSGNLDDATSQKVQKLLIQLAKKEKISLISVTHDLSFAALFDHCFTLKNGKLIPS